LITVERIEFSYPPTPRPDLILFLNCHLKVNNQTLIIRQLRLAWKKNLKCFKLKPPSIPRYIKGDKEYIPIVDANQELWNELTSQILAKLEEHNLPPEKLLKIAGVELPK